MTVMQISDTSRQTFLRHKRLNGSSYKQCGHPFRCKHQEIEDDIHVRRKLWALSLVQYTIIMFLHKNKENLQGSRDGEEALYQHQDFKHCRSGQSKDAPVLQWQNGSAESCDIAQAAVHHLLTDLPLSYQSWYLPVRYQGIPIARGQSHPPFP